MLVLPSGRCVPDAARARAMLDPFQLARRAAAVPGAPSATDPAAARLAFAAWRGGGAWPGGGAHRDAVAVSWDGDLREWRAPFVMAALNTRVVRWSAQLSRARDAPPGAPPAYADGEGFVYDEYLAPGRLLPGARFLKERCAPVYHALSLVAAAGVALGVALGGALLLLPPSADSVELRRSPTRC